MPSNLNLMLIYGLLVLIWATTPLAIVWSVEDIYLMWALVVRLSLALPIAFCLLWVLKVHFPFNRIALHSYIAGSFSLIGSQFFTYVATSYLSSGMIALMFGLAPIMAGFIGRFIFDQQLNRLQWIGMCIAISGLAFISFSGVNQHISPIGIGLMLLAVFSYAMSMFWVKKVNADVAPMAQATGSILISTLAASLIVPFIWGNLPTTLPSMKSMLALAYTVVMASLVAMFCYFYLVRNIQATTLSLTNVMTPVLAMILGSIFNHEKITLGMLIGTTILLLGLFIYFYRDLQANRRFKQKIDYKN